MTSDGISARHWKQVTKLAVDIANAVCIRKGRDSRALTARMMELLDRLERRYGELPSLLATRADYTEDLAARTKLLKKAYRLASERNDAINRTLLAASLAQLYVEDRRTTAEAERWLGRLRSNLSKAWSDFESRELVRLTNLVAGSRKRVGAQRHELE